MKINTQAKKAIYIGIVCSISYLAVYIARNVLGAVTPQILGEGVFTTENVGAMSSVYFFTYAVGQLINGFIGDKLHVKYLTGIGLGASGICCALFVILSNSFRATILVYGLMGFFLSMLNGPITKVAADNAGEKYAPRICTAFNSSALLGSPVAGALAAVMSWGAVFKCTSVMLLAFGLLGFIIFGSFEKKGLIHQHATENVKIAGGGIRKLLKRNIIKFSFISILTGVVRTTVVFWMPTYANQYLGFSVEKSAIIFTVATLAISTNSLLTTFIYEHTGNDSNGILSRSFPGAAVCFLLVFFIKIPALNMVFLVLAIILCCSSSCLMWNQYCPSLSDTGMVSLVTGYLDFLSYMAAAVSTTLFANAVSTIGWGNLILVWFALMIIGIFVILPYNKIRLHSKGSSSL